MNDKQTQSRPIRSKATTALYGTAAVPPSPDLISAGKRIPASVVRELCGGISDMTIWRWQHDPKLNFPAPIYIARRRYWREADVIAWLDAQGAELAA